MNLLLIDSEIPGLDIFMKSCNQNTKFVVYHTKFVTFQMLDKKISSLNVYRYNNLGFVFVNDYTNKLFLDNKPFINYNENREIIENTTTNFIKYLVKRYSIKNIDFLACNLLNDFFWKKYFEFIKKQNNIQVRASDDTTGNLSSGGDWILESTGVNVEKLYFNRNIQYWNYLLDNGPTALSSYIITTDSSNNSYSCGRNNQGQLGIGNTSNRNSFQNITTNIFGKKVISIVGGNEFSLLITNETQNNLYSCGYNVDGQLGLGNNTSPNTTFQNITINISGKKIIAVSAGVRHSLIITSEATNNLYSCGRNSEGQLGIGNTTNINTFQNVTTNISGKKIVFISAGGYSSYALTNENSNNLYSCGRNLDGELGLSDKINKTTFQNVTADISGKKIIAVAGGGFSSYILTNESQNNLYSTGDNDNYGELGLGDYSDRIRYTNVTTNISGKKIISVSPGDQHCCILTNDTSNNLYTCGKNVFGQLGLGYFDSSGINVFKLSSNTILNKYYNGISSGSDCLLVTTSEVENNFYVVGRNNTGLLGLNNTTDINILTNSTLNIQNKKILFNSLMNLDTPNTSSFLSFNYGTNNITYYTTAQNRDSNTIYINSLINPEAYFPSLVGTIGQAYTLEPLGTTFANVISFTINSLYLSNVYYQYNINSELFLMSNDNQQLPYYSYDGENITIYTQILFAYLIITTPETKSGSQFSNLNNLIISATDEPLILPNTRLNYTFYNTPSVIINDFNDWDVSSSITMSSMFRDSSFNGTITNWKPINVKDMSYMFYSSKTFNQKLSYNPINGYWDVSSVTNMESIFNESTLFNNSQTLEGVTEPMNWQLNPNVNLTNDISNSGLTVANAQTLAPDLLVYLNIGVLSENSGTSNYNVIFYNEDNSVGTSNTVNGPSKYTFLCSRYNIAGDSLWNFKIDCSSTDVIGSQLSEGSISSDLSRNLCISGIWYNTPDTACRFYNNNNTLASTLNYSGSSKQNAFLTKYDYSGNFSWRIGMSGTDPSCGIMLSNTAFDTSGNIYGIGRNDYLISLQNSDSTTWRTVGNITDNFNSAWLFKYNNSGTGQWLSRITSTSGTATDGVIVNVDSNNNIYGAGSYDVSTNVYNASNTLVKSFMNKGNWISKYTPSGNVSWATHLRGTNITTRGIGYSLDNDVYFCGGFNTSGVNFVNQTDISFVSLVDISNDNAFISKYNSYGNCSWAARTGYSFLPSLSIGYNTSICSEKQLQDISYPQEGLKFGIYNGYFQDFSGINDIYGSGFFYSNYPFYTGITSNFTNLSTATLNQFGPSPGQDFRSVCWYGFFKPKKTGVYTFKTRSDDASYLFINGNTVVDNGGIHGAQDRTGTCNLISGTYYYIQIFYGERTGNDSLEVSYSEPNNDGTANTSSYIRNATGLDTYYMDENSQYMGFYDNWINQPLGVTPTGSYSTDADMVILERKENYISLQLNNSSNQALYLYNRPAINPNIYKYVHMKYKTTNTPSSFSLRYSTSTSFSSSNSVSFNYPVTNTINTWQHVVFDMSNEPNWLTANWTHYQLYREAFGTRFIEFEYFYISDSQNYPLNETGNSLYVSGVSKAQNISIYNSTFFYNTPTTIPSLGFSGTPNRFIRTYSGTNNTSNKSYLIKYDLNGSCIWSVYLQSTLNVRIQTTKVDKTGNIYVFGHFEGTFSVNNKDGVTFKTLISNGFDTFLIIYSGDGNVLWSCQQGSAQKDQVISSSFGVTPLLQGQSLSLS